MEPELASICIEAPNELRTLICNSVYSPLPARARLLYVHPAFHIRDMHIYILYLYIGVLFCLPRLFAAE